MPFLYIRKRVASFSKKLIRKFTTKEGLLGDYDYLYLFTPEVPFISKQSKTQPFFGLNSEIPVFLGVLLGLQHALAMLAGVVTPPIMISDAANLPIEIQEYLISASLIVSGIFTIVTITRFHIRGPYHIGTGVLSVLGPSFATITVIEKSFPMMYNEGICKVIDGVDQPCPNGYGLFLATSSCCALLEVLLSFIPTKILTKIFPPIVTGPVVLLIGASLIETGFQDWAGGSACYPDSNCSDKKALHWGSAQYIGLGFTVYLTIITCEKWGAPLMKSCAVIVGLLVGCIIAAACGYFEKDSISVAPAATFLWVHTFKLEIYGPLVLPLLAVYIVSIMEAIGDITATSDVSRLEIEGEVYESRIQGGLLADGLAGVFSGLCTITPMSTFAQNNGVISITKCANRTAGYWCAFFLIVMGIFSKFASAIVSIPKAVLGGMTSYLFCSVAVSGIKIISRTEFTRRDRFILSAALLPGFGALLVPTWFDYVFGYAGNNKSLKGFLNAIVLVMETGYSVTGVIAVILNLLLPQIEDDVEEFNEVVLETVGSTSENALESYASKTALKIERSKINQV